MGPPKSRVKVSLKHILRDVGTDIDNWKAVIKCENKPHLDKPVIIRKMIFQTCTLIHDIKKAGMDAFFEALKQSPLLETGTMRVSISVPELMHGLEEVIEAWESTLNRTKTGGPEKDFWKNLLIIEWRLRSYLSLQSFLPSSDSCKEQAKQPEYQSMKRENASLCEQNEQLKKELQKLRTAERFNSNGLHRSDDRKLKETEEKLQQAESEVRLIKLELEKRNNDIKDLEQKYTREIEKLQTEKVHLLTRLSKIAGENLTSGNPNVAVLSDTYRPTKLAEIYLELYDNEWTDSLDQLSMATKKEEDVIKTLERTLRHTYGFCSRHYQSLVKKTNEAINFLDYERDVATLKRSQETNTTSEENRKSKVIKDEGFELQKLWKANSDRPSSPTNSSLSREVPKVKADDKLKKLMKDLSGSMLAVVQDAYLKRFWDDDCTHAMKPYISKCLLVSWMMVVQDPQMCFGEPVQLDGKPVPFNTAVYRAYTKSGRDIDYTVWPCLLLYRGGNLVAKGVAQGKM